MMRIHKLFLIGFLSFLTFGIVSCAQDTTTTENQTTNSTEGITTEYVENRVSEDIPTDFIITHYLEYSEDNIFNYSNISLDIVTGTLKFNYIINSELKHLGLQIKVGIRNIQYPYGEETAFDYYEDHDDPLSGTVIVPGLTSGKTYELFVIVYHHDGSENETFELFHFKSSANGLTKKAWVDLTSEDFTYFFNIYDPQRFITELRVVIGDETNGGVIFDVYLTDFTDYLIGVDNDIIQISFEYGQDSVFETGVLYSIEVYICGDNGYEVLDDFILYSLEGYFGGE